MHRVLKCVRWLAILSSCGLSWTTAAPISAPSQPEAPAEASAADESRHSDIGSARVGLRSDAARPAEKTISSDVGTGQKNLDLLLDLEGRTDKGNTTSGEEARLEAARAARRRLLEGGAAMADKSAAIAPKAVIAPAVGTGAELSDSTRDPSTEGRRWSGSVGTPRAVQDNSGSSDAPAHHNYSYGADFSNAPTRKLLLLLQEYREWVIAAAVAATLLALASGAASRTRRRR
jgi:hypothetical protein